MAAAILGCQIRAEDVVQDCCLRFLANDCAARGALHPAAYLKRMVRNLAFDHLRRLPPGARHLGAADGGAPRGRTMTALLARLLTETTDRMLSLRAASDDSLRQSEAQSWVVAHPDHCRPWNLAERTWIASGEAFDRPLPKPTNRNRLRRVAAALAGWLALAIAAPEVCLRLAADGLTPAGPGRSLALTAGSTVALTRRLGDRGGDRRRGAAIGAAAGRGVLRGRARPGPDAAVHGGGGRGDGDGAWHRLLGRPHRRSCYDRGGARPGQGERQRREHRARRRETAGNRLPNPATCRRQPRRRRVVARGPAGDAQCAARRSSGRVRPPPRELYLNGLRVRRITGIFDLGCPGARACGAAGDPSGAGPNGIVGNVWRAAEK